MRLCVAFVLLFSASFAVAQTSSINAFSPYTMYGIGEINTPGTLQFRSMGGVGVAARQVGTINLLNPAGFSLVSRKSMMLNVELEGQNYYNYQTVAGQEKSSAYNSFNIRQFSLLMPLAANFGMGFSVSPYSSVGYRMTYDHEYAPSDPVWGNVGRVNYSYQGEGDVTEVKLGVGYQLFKNFSVGAAVIYYWGDIDRMYVMTPVSITGSGSYSSITGQTEYGISNFKAQFGVQWNVILNTKRLLTLGASYDLGGNLHPDVKTVVAGDATVQQDEGTLPLEVPKQLSVGAFYQTARWSIGLDCVYQGWASNQYVELTGSSSTKAPMKVAYTDSYTVKMGVEFVPARFDARRFWRRWAYRAGLRAGNHNQTFNGQEIGEMAVTLGLGIPLKFRGVSAIDVGFEYGRRGYDVPEDMGLVRQQYFKFAVGFKLFGGSENHDYWFMRPKYD